MIISARLTRIVEIISSKSFSVIINILSCETPSRLALAEIWPICSSHEIYRISEPRDPYHSLIWSARVDFHIPGSPERSTRLPGVSHPPRTLSSSPLVLERRDIPEEVCGSIFWSSCIFQIDPLPFPFCFFISQISSSVFHSPHVGHYPVHFGTVVWQLEQAKRGSILGIIHSEEFVGVLLFFSLSLVSLEQFQVKKEFLLF